MSVRFRPLLRAQHAACTGSFRPQLYLTNQGGKWVSARPTGGPEQ